MLEVSDFQIQILVIKVNMGLPVKDEQKKANGRNSVGTVRQGKV